MPPKFSFCPVSPPCYPQHGGGDRRLLRAPPGLLPPGLLLPAGGHGGLLQEDAGTQHLDTELRVFYEMNPFDVMSIICPW